MELEIVVPISYKLECCTVNLTIAFICRNSNIVFPPVKHCLATLKHTFQDLRGWWLLV